MLKMPALILLSFSPIGFTTLYALSIGPIGLKQLKSLFLILDVNL